MTHVVIIQPRVLQDLEQAHEYLSNRYSSEVANSWYVGFLDALYSLEHDPDRNGLAPENGKVDAEIRQLIFRRHKNVHQPAVSTQQLPIRTTQLRPVTRVGCIPRFGDWLLAPGHLIKMLLHYGQKVSVLDLAESEAASIFREKPQVSE